MSRARCIAVLLLVSATLNAQEVTLTGRIELIHRFRKNPRNSDVVVWLIPDQPSKSVPSVPVARLVQKDKRFSPHVIAIQTGTQVEFPNQDPFFHDVFSIYRGKPFDLGLYESGSVRKVRFSQSGVSYIFCNIHPEMSAAVLAVPTPFFAITSADGSFAIDHLAPGRYKMQFWYELAAEPELDSLTREIEVDEKTPPISVALHSSDSATRHFNKYGQEYPIDESKSY